MQKEQIVQLLDNQVKAEQYSTHKEEVETHEMFVADFVEYEFYENEAEWQVATTPIIDTEEQPSIEEYCNAIAITTDHNAETYGYFNPNKPFIVLQSTEKDEERFINVEDCTEETLLEMLNEVIADDNPQAHSTGLKPEYHVLKFTE